MVRMNVIFKPLKPNIQHHPKRPVGILRTACRILHQGSELFPYGSRAVKC